jgi:hypothetical protein
MKCPQFVNCLAVPLPNSHYLYTLERAGIQAVNYPFLLFVVDKFAQFYWNVDFQMNFTL